MTVLPQVLFLFYFFLLSLLFLYLPGRFLLRLCNWEEHDFIVTVSLSIGVSISLLLFCCYLLAWAHLAFLYFIIAFIVAVVDIRKSLVEIREHMHSLLSNKALICILVAGALAMTYLTARSGLVVRGSYIFYGINGIDTLFHLALVGDLARSFPPQHFGIAGVQLHGYHFFYDFLVALFTSLFHLDIFAAVFRLFPLFLSFFYGISVLALARTLKWNKSQRTILLFFIYFASNFEYFFNLAVHTVFLTHMPEGLEHILDPSVVLSLSLFFCGFIVLFSANRTWRKALIAMLLIGIMPMVKIYAAILFFLGLLVVVCITVLKKKERVYLAIFAGAAIIAMIVYLPLNNGAGHLVFYPLLYFRHIMEGSLFFQHLSWPVRYQIFASHHNFLRLGIMYAVIIAAYAIETMGIRLILLLAFKKLLKKSFYTLQNVFWLGVIGSSLLIPVFLVQSVSIFNIIQFHWLGYTLLLIPTSAVIGNFFARTTARRKVMIGIIFLFLFLPSFIKNIHAYSTSPVVLSPDLTSRVRFVQKNVPQQDILLVLNRKLTKDGWQDIYETPIISALSSHQVYYEQEGISFADIEDVVSAREKKIDTIQQALTSCSYSQSKDISDEIGKLLEQTQADYVLTLQSEPCLSSNDRVRLVKRYNQYNLYKVK